MTRTEKLFGRADRYLASADVLMAAADYESAVSRAYYAMSYAARAALSQRGSEPKSHSGLVSEFGRVFVAPGLIERAHLSALGRALNDRLLAEYDEDLLFSEHQARAVVAAARAFVERVRTLVETV